MAQEKWKMDKEYCLLIEDLINRPEVQQLDQITHHYTSTRLLHSLSVSYCSYRVAKQLGLNTRAVARAGLLHDLFYYDWREVKFAEGSHAYVHPRIACQNAEKLTPLTDMERDIIIKHMWLATIAFPRYRESYVVTMIDKYCACLEFIQTIKIKTKALFFRF